MLAASLLLGPPNFTIFDRVGLLDDEMGDRCVSEFLREKRFKTRSVAGTLAMGERVVEMLSPVPKLIVLRGNLGAGKTTLVKGIATALGAAEAEEVTSPTFTLVHEYKGPKVRLFHLDLYRLETERELLTLGLDEIAEEPDALVLVEWGEKFPSVVERADGEIAIEHLDGDERLFLVRLKG
jgi:tRNA threonylcarbamoyladenosine biosynthesis protein TsaE